MFDSVFMLIGELAIPALLIYIIVRIIRNKNKRSNIQSRDGFSAKEKITIIIVSFLLIFLIIGKLAAK